MFRVVPLAEPLPATPTEVENEFVVAPFDRTVTHSEYGIRGSQICDRGLQS